MEKENQTTIIEFEVIAPTNDMEKIGKKLELSDFGMYCPDGSLRGYSLLFLLDHTLHYRISKIMMQGKVYEIPVNRPKNYTAESHPDTFKFRKTPNRYDVLYPSSTPAMVKKEDGLFVEFNEVKHLF